MIKAVVFDCFGVLVGRGYWYVYKLLGGDPVVDYNFVEDMLTKANLGQITDDEFAGFMATRVNKSLDEYHAAFDEDEHPNVELFEFIADKLKGHFKIGMLTNANKGVIEHKIPPEQLKLFDKIVVSGDVGLVKPDPAIFQLMADKLKVKPAEVVFVDDRSNYLSGAATIGMHTILYKDFDEFKPELSKLTGKKWK